MKIWKQGFSLTELLLCVAIIGIVSAFGATLTKKTTEKAYNMYFLSGYTGLYTALADINSTSFFNSSVSKEQLLKELMDRFAGSEDESDTTNNIYVFAAKNGIKYTVEDIILDKHIYIIKMQVPQPKTRANKNGYSISSFIFNNNGEGFLVPIDAKNVSNYVNLQNRPDLLPFYIDDGTVGRYRTDGSGNSYYNAPHIMSYQEAACNLHGNSDLSATIINAKIYQISNGAKTDDWNAGFWGDENGTFYKIVDCSGYSSSSTGILKIKI